jgi:DMSO reductase anchor subunit
LPETSDLPFDETTVKMFRESLLKNKRKEKISSFPEWPLILFSLLIAYITGSFIAKVLLPAGISGPFSIILGLIGLGISSIHLGKKFRAPRALLNLRQSWLSREIAFYALFLVFLTCQIIFYPQVKWLAWIAIVFGFITLYALDKVYTVIPTIRKQYYHSANALLTAFFFAAMFSEFMFGIIVFGGIKFILYIRQFFNRFEQLHKLTILSGIVRVLFGFLFPVIFWIWDITSVLTYSIMLILIAEIIDRCEFYESLKIISPAKQMVIDLEKQI